MATVYGYFRSDEDARRAANRCEELGITSTVVTQQDHPDYVDTSGGHSAIRREGNFLRTVFIIAGVVALLGILVWFIMPAMWGKLALAGPLLVALYGIGVGIAIGTLLVNRRRYGTDELLPSDIATHEPAERVVVIRTLGADRTAEIEQMLESEGAIEVIHRAA